MYDTEALYVISLDEYREEVKRLVEWHDNFADALKSLKVRNDQVSCSVHVEI